MAKKKPAPKGSATVTPSPPGSAPAIPAAPAPPKPSFANIFPGVPSPGSPLNEYAVPPGLAACVQELESELNLPVWMLVQDRRPEREEYARDSINMIGDVLASAFFAARHTSLKRGQKIALLIDSNGGTARSAYELAMLLRRHCGGFVAVIPRHAKSAATLLSLGAEQIIMNDHAELGPLDVQVWDADREELLSGLDEVKALEQLHAFAMQAFDKTMLQLLRRTNKKAKSLLPVVAHFVTSLAKPMFAKVDVVRFNQMSRALKIAEEYGKRLLEDAYEGESAEISRILIENYPEHGFPIYPDEIRSIGLRLASVKAPLRTILEKATLHLHNVTCVGRIVTQ